ncbi:hypothetical protein [Virgibacillus sp. DJP39]|uniref:hypothetical protein n=1 Tax=Virgibacillus sp. DJP39 TaxID=3409790 RepID=UPI003BB76D93
MNKVKYTIMGISLFVYTLAVIGVTTMVVYPDPVVNEGTPLTEKDIDNICDQRESVGF